MLIDSLIPKVLIVIGWLESILLGSVSRVVDWLKEVEFSKVLRRNLGESVKQYLSIDGGSE
jgi:hypothetical protein